MSVGEFLSIFFTQGINQPFFPEEVGAFGYPIWCMWFVAAFGIITQQANEPRTTKQKRIAFFVVSIFLLLIIWGAVRAFFYTLEVM